jgi:hypothetical protein
VCFTAKKYKSPEVYPIVALYLEVLQVPESRFRKVRKQNKINKLLDSKKFVDSDSESGTRRKEK